MTAIATPIVGAPVRESEVRAAAAELAKMRRSLRSWLEYRLKNDAVIAGRLPAKVSREQAQALVASTRDFAVEQDLATRLHALLSQVMPGAALPDADVSRNPAAAVELAMIALEPARAATQESLGSIMGAIPWWPVLIVGGVLLAVTTAIGSYADVAKERERYACIKAGACTDYGFWIKAAAVLGIGWFVWEKTSLGAAIKKKL